MKTVTNYFDQHSLRILASMKGASWRFVTGDWLAERPSALFNWDQAIVGTNQSEVTVYADEIVLDFEGEPLEYTSLRVVSGAANLLNQQTPERMFYQFNGETIEHIRIVRDTIKENTNGTTTWEYSTDVGVVFELEHGAVGIIKNGHGGQALLVERANTTQTLDLIDNSDQWQDDLTTRYESSRQFFPLKELLLPESDVT